MTQPISHPLEDVFGIEEGSTFKFKDEETPKNAAEERAVALLDPTTGEIVERKSDASVDDLEKEERLEDLHIDVQLDSIRGAAFEAFEQQARLAQEVDPKFSARNAEVAAQYLNIALNAVNSRVDAKFKRQKVRLAKSGGQSPQTVNNNIIVANRNDLLKQILGGAQSDSVTVIENGEDE